MSEQPSATPDEGLASGSDAGTPGGTPPHGDELSRAVAEDRPATDGEGSGGRQGDGLDTEFVAPPD